jgi:uncharacterized protein YggU (UPF0235/DUF167 family)
VAAKDPAATAWRGDAAGVTVSTRLTPRADRDAIDGLSTLSDGRRVILARVRAVAENGKANDAARKLLAAALAVAPCRVRLVSGASARQKLFRIEGEPGPILAALERAAGKEPAR